MKILAQCKIFICMSALLLILSCAHNGPKSISYEVFSAQVEHVPDLVNALPDAGAARPALIEVALRDGAAKGQKLEFLRVVRGTSYTYYIFQVRGLEDMYLSYATNDDTSFLYLFRYAGEAKPQFED